MMNSTTIPYNAQLKKLQLEAIPFNTISLKDIPAPFHKDYSGHADPAYRNCKTYDRFGFRDALLRELSTKFKDTVIKVMILTPRPNAISYDAFAFLADKQIVALHFNEDVDFRKSIGIIFEKNYERLKKDKEDGLFERQPELNPNPQFLLVLGKGQFSQSSVNSGMVLDQRPYENTGAYLYKNAPQRYNATKIAREKQNYLKKYIDTNGTNIDSKLLTELFYTYIKTRKLSLSPPANNQSVYQDFEQVAGFPFPKELKTFLGIHNGIPGSNFLTASEVLAE